MFLLTVSHLITRFYHTLAVSESSEVERLEDLHRRRNLLAAYCKLIVHGVLEMSAAAELYPHYMKVKVHSSLQKTIQK